MSIGSNIRDLRTRSKLNQTQLAERAGVSQATVCDYEKDNVKHHRARELSRIAAALGVTVAHLESNPAPMIPEAQSENHGVSEDEQTLLLIYRSLTRNNKKIAIRLLKAL